MTANVSIEQMQEEVGRWQKRAWQAEAEADQLRVQLAGCSVAALGGITDPTLARPGQYGYSASYQDVLDLRRKYELLKNCEPFEAKGGSHK